MNRTFVTGALLGCAACGLDLAGTLGADASTSAEGGTIDGGSSGGVDLDAGGTSKPDGSIEAGPIVHDKTWSGMASGEATITVANVQAGAGLYIAAITTKNFTAINSVSGLGVTWARARAQCGGRSQTMVELWTATSPSANGSVSATIDRAYQTAVMTVSRYPNATKIGGALSANTYGPNGACDNGNDNTNLSLTVPKTGNGPLFGAAAIRLRSHAPGPGNTEILELHHGSSGDTAGLALIETSGNVLAGTLDGSDGTDWALAGAELLP